jgi:two-component system, LytTR family, sensor kinase
VVLDRVRENFVAHFLLWIAMCCFVAFILSSNYSLRSTDIIYNVIGYVAIGGVAYVALVKNFIHQLHDNRAAQYLFMLFFVSILAASLHVGSLNFVHHGHTDWSFRVYMFLAYLFLLVFGSSLEFIDISNKLKLRFLENEKYKNKQELDLLKARIEPHFLFNALNNIYSLSRKNDPRTQDYIMDVSTLLRYIVDQSNNDTVSLDQEVEFMRSFVELERTRFKADDQCSIEVKVVHNLSQRIAPLLCFPFLENAFKHSENTSGARRKVHISIYEQGSELGVTIVNSKGQVSEKRIREREVSVAQARTRLLSLQQDSTLNILDESSTYTVEIKIPLYE